MTSTQSALLAIGIYAACVMLSPLYPLLVIGGFMSYQSPSRYLDLNTMGEAEIVKRFLLKQSPIDRKEKYHE